MSYHQRTQIDVSMKLRFQMAAEKMYEPIIGFWPFDWYGVPAKCPGGSQHSFLVISKHIEPDWVSRILAFDKEIDASILLACEQDIIVAYGGYNVKIITADRTIHVDRTVHADSRLLAFQSSSAIMRTR